MTTLLEPRITLAYLAYLGYPHSSASLLTPSPPPSSSSSSSSSSSPHPNLIPTTSALQVTRPRRPSRRKGTPVDRNVFLAYVLGAAGSGKTSLLRAFVGKGFDFEEEERGRRGVMGGGGEKGAGAGRGKGKSVVNCVEEGGGERYLVVSGRLSFAAPRRSTGRSPLGTPSRQRTLTDSLFGCPFDATAPRIRLDVRVRGPPEQEEARARRRARLRVRLERYEQL